MFGSDDEMELDGEPPVFRIKLAPTGDEGSAFHTQNDPKSPFQRENVIERKGAVDIRCYCVDIIHGLFAADSKFFSTQLVLQFRFDPRKRARRIAQVDVELRFAGSAPGVADPEVFAIAPNGRFSFSQTTQTETTTIGGDVNIGGGSRSRYWRGTKVRAW
ncbi:MAG: hypothetical protein M1834_009344 [Cirrosporium novae-zelandiae]|nr:MAG: hypothetical protein M1834_009344 [Cirrosporium novae-zelandiae]